jgi:hypothetical protein
MGRCVLHRVDLGVLENGMTMRQRRKQFWWTWHLAYDHYFHDDLFCWGVGRIKHQRSK